MSLALVTRLGNYNLFFFGSFTEVDVIAEEHQENYQENDELLQNLFTFYSMLKVHR